ncbi:MAG: hypothetical protein JW943_03185 [Deltaproteobacteria bacterium]|nr:hypothetical protein [Deltaproteobacteria bacterium]
MYFNLSQVSLANSVFAQGERLAGRYFRLSPEAVKNHRYDVKTLAYLEKHEVNDRAFAHICKYQYKKPDAPVDSEGLHFYKICLQDHRILDAVERANSFIKLNPLLLYIATHELVHVIRFDAGEIDFDASREDKEREEDRVHEITKEILQQVMDADLGLVLDCFSSRYKIGDLYH